MHNIRTLLATGCLFALSALATNGCVVSSGDPAPVYTVPVEGRLTLRWTIGELNDPNACAGAAVLDVQMFAANGVAAGEYQAACSALATTIVALAPGGYTATARLIDGTGQPRTTPVTLNPFVIRSGEELIIDIDFPTSAFF